MKRLTPNMAVENVEKSVKFYTEILGFKVVLAVSEDKSYIGDEIKDGISCVWANVMFGEVGFMFQREDSFEADIAPVRDIGASASFYIEVENIEALYSSIKGKVEIIKELNTVWYGAKEFYIKDINGYILGFSQRV